MTVTQRDKQREKWQDLTPTTQAAMRCNEPVFWAWLFEAGHVHKRINSERAAAEVVRAMCGVASRADLSKPNHLRSRILWHQFDYQFQAWKALEHG